MKRRRKVTMPIRKRKRVPVASINPEATRGEREELRRRKPVVPVKP